MMFLAYFMIGIGVSLIFCGAVFLLRDWLVERKFKNYLNTMKQEGALAIKEASREVSELTFRDKNGVLCTVKIVIDHAIGDSLAALKKDAEFSGSLNDLMTGHKIAESTMGQTEEFIFSSRAVQDMQALGMEPDEVVRQMLRAAGRIT